MWGLALHDAVSCLAQGRDVGLPLRFVHKGNSMKYAVIAALMLATPSLATESECKSADNLFQTYEKALDFVIALSESCETSPTATCEDVLEPLQAVIESMSKDDPAFILSLQSKNCKE